LFADQLKSFLIEKGGHEVHVFKECALCLSAMTEKPEIVLLDNHLNNTQKDKSSDMHLLDIIRKDFPDVHVVVLAKGEGYGTAMQTILHGAEQYVIIDENTFETVHNMVAGL